MDEEQYGKELLEIRRRAAAEVAELNRRYAMANNNVAVGDIVTDHIGCVLVEEVQTAVGFGKKLPECYYYGPELRKKDKQPKKSGGKRSVAQSNLVGNV